MTVYEIETRMLSLRSWLVGCVLPSAITLCATLLMFKTVTGDPTILNHNAVIVGFFIFYFVLIRGGHLIMIRSLHKELKVKYAEAYFGKLAALPPKFKKRNLGFTLASMKRDLINEFRV